MTTKMHGVLAALAALLISDAALAQVAPHSAAGASSSGTWLGATPAPAERLTSQRGGSSAADIRGQLADTTATNVSTGANAIREGAFANSTGLSTVIQNSGANVLIQNSMIVNVRLQ